MAFLKGLCKRPYLYAWLRWNHAELHFLASGIAKHEGLPGVGGCRPLGVVGREGCWAQVIAYQRRGAC